ncbi:MAG: DEAD/DEAH box helicase [Candidatus Saccharibacteria bacterium]|nr:DEAD/DEAH box helicase [Candidatus Saccharibacteria bacterium]
MPYAYRSHGTSGRRSARNRSRSFGGNKHRKNNSNRGSYIDPRRFINVATPLEVEEFTPKHSFMDFGFEPVINANLIEKKYIEPSPIQDQAIPLAMTGKDIIGIAGTGTGKTAAFSLPILNQMLTDTSTQALVVAPTRELAEQIRSEFRSFAKNTRINDALLIGGSNMGKQINELKRRPRIVIGTPGRIKDHIQRRTLKLGFFNKIVLDEVDRMLDMGFVNDVTEILSNVSANRQSLFFSATMDDRVRRLIDNFAREPQTVQIKTSVASNNIHQDVVHYRASSEKIEKLHGILDDSRVEKTLIFNETRRNVEKLSKDLAQRGFSSDSIHGGKSQGQRKRALAKFKSNEVAVLIATDVAARGIDVSDITHVINYTIPKEYEDYVHRIGRAGRAGRVGHALTFVEK